MTFRTRLLTAFGVVVLVPLLVFGFGIRREMARRITGEYERRVNTLVSVINADLARETDRVEDVVARVRESDTDDELVRLRRGRGRGRFRPVLCRILGVAGGDWADALELRRHEQIARRRRRSLRRHGGSGEHNQERRGKPRHAGRGRAASRQHVEAKLAKQLKFSTG